MESIATMKREVSISTRRFAGFSLLFGFCLLVLPRVAHAYLNFSYDQMVGLPPYCQATRINPSFNIRSDQWKYWERRFGRSWDTMHHYCAGQIRMREARRYRPSSAEYTASLNNAISEFEFLLRRSDAELIGFPLWAEMLAWRGRAAVLLGNWKLAYDSYEKARRVQPNYWPAYLEWAEALVRLKVNHQARAVIQSGLRIDPSEPSMRLAYTKLGGSLSEFPIPVESIDKPAAPASQAASDLAGDVPAAASVASN